MMEAGERPTSALRKWWKLHAVGPVPAHDAVEYVQRLEVRYDLTLPDDFRHYLLEIAPQTDMDDDNVVSWYGLARIASLTDELASVNAHYPEGQVSSDPRIAAEQDKYIMFADYMIWCWGWAVCCSDGPNRGKVAMVGRTDSFVADSVTDFVRAYINDPDEMTHRGT